MVLWARAILLHVFAGKFSLAELSHLSLIPS